MVPSRGNPRFTARINDKPYTLAWDMAALIALDKEIGVTRENIKAELNKVRTRGEQLEFVVKLVYCMTRSNDEPPTMKDVERMSPEEVMFMQQLLMTSIGLSEEGGVPPGKKNAVPGPDAGSARSGTGAGRSKSRRRAGSGQRSSGG